MNYELSLGSFFLGLLILFAGIAFLRWYQWVADNFSGGVGSYERFKLYAVITCVVGLLVMVNLHAVILSALVDVIFPG